MRRLLYGDALYVATRQLQHCDPFIDQAAPDVRHGSCIRRVLTSMSINMFVLHPESLTHPPQATPGSTTSSINTTPQDTMPRLASAQPPTPTAAMGHDKQHTSPFAQESIPDTTRVVDQDQGARKMGQVVDQQKGEEAGEAGTVLKTKTNRMLQMCVLSPSCVEDVSSVSASVACLT